MGVRILAIESSCDDTAASVIVDGNIRSNVIASQQMHKIYGGVVPELASRAHNEHILPVVKEALKEAGVEKQELDAIACTRGPGLMGSLMVGFTFAKSLAFALGKPLIDVHHMQAHILAHFIEDPRPSFPFLCLTVSGGHTQLVVVKDYLDMEIIGETIDDAAGEAFDKAGKMMGLPYPAGPVIDRLAAEGIPKFDFPEPQVGELEFSFSGLKTSFLYFLKAQIKKDPDFIEKNLNDLCASLQHRIVTILLNKLEKASENTGIKSIGIAGGVSANRGLRSALTQKAEALGWETYVPKILFCTDNAAMIAMTAHYKYLQKDFCDFSERPEPRLKWEAQTVK